MITKNKYKNKIQIRRKKNIKLSNKQILDNTLLEFRLLYQGYGYDYPSYLVKL